MTTLEKPRSFLDLVAAHREANRRSVLDAARRLGSTLRGVFDAEDLAAESGIPTPGLHRIVHILKKQGRWPYATAEPGVYRDPRPWFERIARVLTPADVEDAR